MKVGIVATLVSSIDAHGYMSVPAIRGVLSPPFLYEKQSLGATGAGNNIPVCHGGGDNRAYATQRAAGDPVTAMTPGSSYTFEAYISAHHCGHMTVRVCPYLSVALDTNNVLDNCIALEDSDGDKFWWLSPGVGKKTWTATLPTLTELQALGSVSGMFSVQWRWNTGNSGCPHPDAYKCRFPNNAPADWLINTITDTLNTLPACSSSDGDWKDFALYPQSGSCTDAMCNSEVFTNCADVTFDGIESKTPATVAVSTGSSSVDSTPPVSGGTVSAGSGGGCLFAPKSISATDDWCCQNCHGMKDCATPGNYYGAGDSTPKSTCRTLCAVPTSCGGGGGAGGGSDAVTVSHTIAPAAGTGSLTGVAGFCSANLDYFCGTDTLPQFANDLCACTVVTAPVAESEPESEPESASEPAATPESAATPATSDSSATSSAEDPASGPLVATPLCKLQCQNLCNARSGGVATNQGWGTPRYLHCKCSDDYLPTFAGCTCENAACPTSLAQVNATAEHSTKFSRHAMQSHHALQVDAHGRAKHLTLDDER